jgi:hypothetical protein
MEDYSLFDDRPGEESEEDLVAADVRAIEQAAVYSSDWTTETILNSCSPSGRIDEAPSW